MSFFELPPRPPETAEPDEYQQPEWLAAPANLLGAAVPIRLVLARTDDVAVAVTDATAYPSGFEFKLVIKARSALGELDFDPLELRHPLWHHPPYRRGELPPEFLRFGIEFSDGSKVTNLGEPWQAADPEQPPGSPVLVPGGGGGGGGSWESDYWVWPLPPLGPFAFVCEWPAKGVPLTRKEIDAALLRDAATQAEVLWDEPRGRRPSGGGWRSCSHLGSTGPEREKTEPEDG